MPLEAFFPLLCFHYWCNNTHTWLQSVSILFYPDSFMPACITSADVRRFSGTLGKNLQKQTAHPHAVMFVMIQERQVMAPQKSKLFFGPSVSYHNLGRRRWATHTKCSVASAIYQITISNVTRTWCTSTYSYTDFSVHSWVSRQNSCQVAQLLNEDLWLWERV